MEHTEEVREDPESLEHLPRYLNALQRAQDAVRVQRRTLVQRHEHNGASVLDSVIFDLGRAAEILAKVYFPGLLMPPTAPELAESIVNGIGQREDVDGRARQRPLRQYGRPQVDPLPDPPADVNARRAAAAAKLRAALAGEIKLGRCLVCLEPFAKHGRSNICPQCFNNR